MSIHVSFGAADAKQSLPYDATNPQGAKQNALYLAVINNDSAGVDRALANGAQLNSDQYPRTGSRVALKNNHLDIVQYLFKKGMKPDYHGELILAIDDAIDDNWNAAKIKFLTDNGVTPDMDQVQKSQTASAWYNPQKSKDAKPAAKLIWDAYHKKHREFAPWVGKIIPSLNY
jgi:hypothetical protein